MVLHFLKHVPGTAKARRLRQVAAAIDTFHSSSASSGEQLEEDGCTFGSSDRCNGKRFSFWLFAVFSILEMRIDLRKER